MESLKGAPVYGRFLASPTNIKEGGQAGQKQTLKLNRNIIKLQLYVVL
jgi:hypothetical protein